MKQKYDSISQFLIEISIKGKITGDRQKKSIFLNFVYLKVQLLKNTFVQFKPD